jgi:hypothetical protein
MEFGTRWKSLSGATPVLDVLGLLVVLVILGVLDVLGMVFSDWWVVFVTERKSLKVAYLLESDIKYLGLRPLLQILNRRALRV